MLAISFKETCSVMDGLLTLWTSCVISDLSFKINDLVSLKFLQ